MPGSPISGLLAHLNPSQLAANPGIVQTYEALLGGGQEHVRLENGDATGPFIRDEPVDDSVVVRGDPSARQRESRVLHERTGGSLHHLSADQRTDRDDWCGAVVEGFD